MASLAAPADLEEWLGVTFDPSASARAQAVLNAVSSLVRSEAGLTWDAVAVPDDVQAVTLTVAARVFNNPAAVASESVGTYSVRYSDPQAAGLYLTKGDKAILGKYRANARGLWSMRLTRDDAASDTEYVPIVGTDAMFPWYAGDVEV
jgi:hypothetical protein